MGTKQKKFGKKIKKGPIHAKKVFQLSGPPRTTRVKAKRAVFMAMCRRLHEDGLLDENLHPRKKTLDAFIDELDCSNSGLPKIGTKRSKSYYEIQSPMELRLVPTYGVRPLYKIEMKLMQELSYNKIVKQYSVYNPEAYPRKLGLVIGSPLPTGAMHPFDLFTNSGIEINMLKCQIFECKLSFWRSLFLNKET